MSTENRTELPPLDVTQEDYKATYGANGHLEYSHVHAKLHCRERQLREALAQLTLLREGRDQNGGWISVEERLPEDACDVLVCDASAPTEGPGGMKEESDVVNK